MELESNILTPFSVSGERFRFIKEWFEAEKAAFPRWSFTWNWIDRNEASNAPYGLQSYDDKPSGRLLIITPILVFSDEPLKREIIDPVKPKATTAQILSAAIESHFNDPIPDLSDPNWNGDRFTNWEYYVDQIISSLWNELPLEARLIEYFHAAARASEDEPQDYR